MAISITPTQIQSGVVRPSGLVVVREVNRFLLLGSFGVLVAVIAGWFVLTGYAVKLNSDEAALEQQHSELVRKRGPAVERELRAVVARSSLWKGFLAVHGDATEGFRFLERVVQPGVVFANLSVDYENNTIHVEMSSPTIEGIAQQIAAFGADSHVRSVQIDAVSSTFVPEGGSVFRTSATILFSGEAFRYRSATVQ